MSSLKALVLIPVHHKDPQTEILLRPLAGRSALDRALDFSKNLSQIEALECHTCVLTDDEAVRKTCENYGNILLPKRHQSNLREALAEGLLAAEGMIGARSDYVFVLEPTNPFRPDMLGAEALDMLHSSEHLDSVICGQRFHGRVWGGEEDLLPVIEGLHGRDTAPVSFLEMLGLLAVCRRHVITDGHRVGKHVGLVVLERKWNFIDLQDDESFEMAELLEPIFR